MQTRNLSSNRYKFNCFPVIKTLAKLKNYINSSFVKQEIKISALLLKC